MIPIFRSGSRTDASNYRPISLTCISWKVVEHIVLNHVNKHLTANSIITPFQHDFRQGLPCKSQLNLATYDWATVLNNRGQTDVLLLDFSKAFDKVSHSKLIHKPGQYGITGETLKWIEAFLRHRSQFVVVNGCHSSTSLVTSGVPQGLFLGPTQFLIFINDIFKCSTSNLRLFVDDCCV